MRGRPAMINQCSKLQLGFTDMKTVQYHPKIHQTQESTKQFCNADLNTEILTY